MTILRSLNRWLTGIEYGVLVMQLGAIVILAFSQVVLRNVFGTGFVWADTVVRHLVLWVGFTGAAIATTDNRHISIDALSRFIPGRAKHMVHLITNIFSVVVCSMLASAAWRFMVDERSAGGDLVLGIPTWVALSVIPAGYWLIGFHFLVKAAESLLSLREAR